MHNLVTALLLIMGLVLLTIGAEVLIRGASALAAAVHISPLVIGLTIVAFGTSAPELVVSIQAALRGQPDIALGNVIGSNIFNVLFILGVSALIVPLVVSQQLVRFDVPLMVGLSILLLVFALDGNIGRIEGAMFTAGLIAYTCWAVVQSRREQQSVQQEYAQEYGAEKAATGGRILLQVLAVAVGLALLIGGSRLFSDAAVSIARSLGVSELVIGLTIVAVGTSLPEVATSIVAAVRGERDIAVGNVVGSNIFNIMGVLGISSLISSTGIRVAAAAITADIPIMTAVAIACLPIFFTGHLIARWEGAVFLGYYVSYTAYLILTATQSTFAQPFTFVMLLFVLPLTVITLIVGVWRARRTHAS